MKLTTSQFAERYVVSDSYVRRLKREGKLVVAADGSIDMDHPTNRLTAATLVGSAPTRLARRLMYPGKRRGGRGD